jgi:hypothetical protein
MYMRILKLLTALAPSGMLALRWLGSRQVSFGPFRLLSAFAAFSREYDDAVDGWRGLCLSLAGKGARIRSE